MVGSWNNDELGREEQDSVHPDSVQHRGEDEAEPEADPGGAWARGRRRAGCRRLHLTSFNSFQP